MSEPVTHDGYTTESLIGDVNSAGCSCGWNSPEYNTKEEAEAALSIHYKEIKQS